MPEKKSSKYAIRASFFYLISYISQIPIRFYYALQRRSILDRCFAAGFSVRFRMPIFIYQPELVSFGNRVDVGENVVIRGGGGVRIGDNVLIASGAAIISQGHPIVPPRWNLVISNEVQIGDEVWIGANATILPGVTVGDGSIIAAGAVVTRNVPSSCIVAGVPARVIRKIDRNDLMSASGN